MAAYTFKGSRDDRAEDFTGSGVVGIRRIGSARFRRLFEHPLGKPVAVEIDGDNLFWSGDAFVDDPVELGQSAFDVYEHVPGLLAVFRLDPVAIFTFDLSLDAGEHPLEIAASGRPYHSKGDHQWSPALRARRPPRLLSPCQAR